MHTCEEEEEEEEDEEEEEEEEDFGHLATFWFGTSAMLLALLGVLLVMKTVEDEQYGVITAYKFAVLEILRIFLY